jgi:hypothetical protein
MIERDKEQGEDREQDQDKDPERDISIGSEAIPWASSRIAEDVEDVTRKAVS